MMSHDFRRTSATYENFSSVGWYFHMNTIFTGFSEKKGRYWFTRDRGRGVLQILGYGESENTTRFILYVCLWVCDPIYETLV